MINRVDFRESFRYYDREVVIEIIDLFLETYKPLVNELRKSISEGDIDKVIMHAHSLKGLAGTFLEPVARNVAASLEEKARNNEFAEIPALFSGLELSIEEMAGDLQKIRDQFKDG